MATDERRWLSAPFKVRNYRAMAYTMTTYARPFEARDRHVRVRAPSWSSGSFQ